MRNDPAKQWIAELLAAGWQQYRGSKTTWQAPDGELFIGPYGAWKWMKRARGEKVGSS